MVTPPMVAAILVILERELAARSSPFSTRLGIIADLAGVKKEVTAKTKNIIA